LFCIPYSCSNLLEIDFRYNCLFDFLEICNRTANKTSLDANTVWQQVVTSLNEQLSIRDALPVGGGFISK
jgi:hypothetical protein